MKIKVWSDMPCGCRIFTVGGHVVRMTHCSLHNAAPALRDALLLAKERLEEIDAFSQGKWFSGSTLEAIHDALFSLPPKEN